jgi:hypothetical protein
MTPELEPRRAHFVLGRIDEILTWEKIREKERDVRFVELGDFLKQRGQQPLLHSVRIQSLKPQRIAAERSNEETP